MMGFAKTVSFFLQPFFLLAPIPFILVSKFSQDYSHALRWTIISYAFVLIVVLFVLIGVTVGVFSNFNVSKKEQRPLLALFSAFAIFCYLISLIVLRGPKILFVLVFAMIFGLIIYLIVNKWIKASIHVAIAAAVFLLIEIAYGKYFSLLFILIPLLAWSRVKMKQHTLMETVIGSIFGIVITFIVYLITKQYFLGMIIS
jgi:membrane-associated phospholipid phosphatase